MPYSHRRIIVVADGVSPHSAESKGAASLARNVLSAALLPNVLVGAVVLTAMLIRARNEMRAGGEDLLAVSPAVAAKLRFPVGHPRKKVAYIGHPVDPPVYIPVADFHRLLFEHKVAEALRLIRSLGATSIEVSSIEGWDQSLGINLGVNIPAAESVDVGASAGRTKAQGRVIFSTMKLSPAGPPVLPADLVWLPHEPLWQEIAQARLESNLDSFALDVRSTDDYGVNAGLKALVAKAGLEVGGSYVEHRNTIWRLQGRFS